MLIAPNGGPGSSEEAVQFRKAPGRQKGSIPSGSQKSCGAMLGDDQQVTANPWGRA